MSMLSLFECISCSSSLFLEEMNLIAIINLISYLSDFWRSFMMSFKYDLILSWYPLIERFFIIITINFIFDIIVPPKNTYFYWFGVIFFQLKTVPDISIYSVFGCSNCLAFWLFSWRLSATMHMFNMFNMIYYNPCLCLCSKDS